MEYYDSITGELVKTTTVVERTRASKPFIQIPMKNYEDEFIGILNFIKDDFENPTRKTAVALKKFIKNYEEIIEVLKQKQGYLKPELNTKYYFCFNKMTNAINNYTTEMGMPWEAASKELRSQMIEEIQMRLKGNKHEDPHPSRLIVGAVEKLIKLESSDGADKHECECGCLVSNNKQVIEKHKKSKKHVDLMNRLNPETPIELKRTYATWWQCECGDIHKGDEYHYKRHLKSAKCRDKRDVYMQALGKYVFEAKILSDAEAEALLKSRREDGVGVYGSATLQKTMDEYEDDEDAAAITADTYDQVINDLQQLDFYSDASSEGTQSCTPSPPPMIVKKVIVKRPETLYKEDLKARVKAAEIEEVREKRQKAAEFIKQKKEKEEYKEQKRNPPSKVDIDEDEDVKCECGCYVRKSFMNRHLLDEIHKHQMNIIAEEAMYAAEEEYYNQGLIPPTSNNVVLEIKDPLVF